MVLAAPTAQLDGAMLRRGAEALRDHAAVLLAALPQLRGMTLVVDSAYDASVPGVMHVRWDVQVRGASRGAEGRVGSRGERGRGFHSVAEPGLLRFPCARLSRID